MSKNIEPDSTVNKAIRAAVRTVADRFNTERTAKNKGKKTMDSYLLELEKPLTQIDREVYERQLNTRLDASLDEFLNMMT